MDARPTPDEPGTRERIVQAARRLIGTQHMLAQWDAEGAAPCERIRLFIDILIRNRALILKFGCPVGTLCTELAKLEHAALPEANMLFTLFREWLRRQFKILGAGKDADLFAMHLLAFSQGVATLANAFNDETFLRRAVREMHAWLDTRLADAHPRRMVSRRKRNKEKY